MHKYLLNICHILFFKELKNTSTGVKITISSDGVGLEQDSSRIQEEKKRINLKITPDRLEDCNEVVEQQQKLKRSTLILSKRIGIDLKKNKWDQKYKEDLEIEASESDQETLSIIEIESESEPDPEPSKVNCNLTL